MIQRRQTNLLEIVLTLHSPGCFPSGLHGRQQEANQNSNNSDNHKQLHQCEAAVSLSLSSQHPCLLLCSEREKEKSIAVTAPGKASSKRDRNGITSNRLTF